MKNTILKLSLFALVINSWACQKHKTIKGSGDITTETRVVNSFDGIKSTGSATINVVYGAIQKVEVTANVNLMGHVQTRVDNSILTLELEDNYNYRNVDLRLTVTIPDLTYLKNTGSGEFDVSGFNYLRALSIVNSGSGEIKLDGNGDDLTVKNSGSGELRAYDFIAKNYDITNSGSGEFKIHCTDFLNSKNSGSGTIYYKGYPSITSTNSGSGSIIDAN